MVSTVLRDTLGLPTSQSPLPFLGVATLLELSLVREGRSKYKVSSRACSLSGLNRSYRLETVDPSIPLAVEWVRVRLIVFVDLLLLLPPPSSLSLSLCSTSSHLFFFIPSFSATPATTTPRHHHHHRHHHYHRHYLCSCSFSFLRFRPVSLTRWVFFASQMAWDDGPVCFWQRTLVCRPITCCISSPGCSWCSAMSLPFLPLVTRIPPRESLSCFSSPP